MAVPKRKKCKSKACVRLNFLKYKKTSLLKIKKLLNINTCPIMIKNHLIYIKKQKQYLI